ncbi:MAG TPA: hypothetical protein VIJ41_16320 [Candidatus Nanopelagicales bacterium]
MSHDLAAGRLDRCGPGVDGEVVAGREPGHVADLADDGCGGDRGDPDDLRQVRRGRSDCLAEPSLHGLDIAVEDDDIVDEVDRELTSGLTNCITRAHGRDHAVAWATVSCLGAPEAMSCMRIWCSRFIAWVRERTRSRRRSDINFNATVSSSRLTSRSPGLRSPTTATACASAGSLLRP